MQRMVPRKQFSFVRRNWHIILVIVSLIVLFVFVALGITQSVLSFKSYDAWVVILWIFFNVVLFLSSLLLSLPYVFHSIRNKSNDGWVVVYVLAFIYFMGLLIAVPIGNAFAYSCFLLIAFFALLVADIVFLHQKQ